MKINPVITDNIQIMHTSFVVDFRLKYNITFIIGDSGVGKSAVYSIIEEAGANDSKIRCINYLDYQKNYKASIRKSKGKLFIIDNADILLDDKLRQYISTDSNNQYIIIGRNPTGLLLLQDNIYELVSQKDGRKTIFTLINPFL